ncbi:MAG: hypothetical protein Q9P01_21145 [Anaerolineae bacterium]|nr:hypothetical protein [Anaerolineae bacterium]MDQ7037255.1 hypothetical protein [Anaerolineae bacterium]
MDNFVLTLDLDWAADFMIDAVAQMLLAAGVKATFFVTHDSPAVRRLREHPDLFELGIHPNFLPNSSQGSTVAEILDFCMALVPDATSMRSHALVQSAHIWWEVVKRTPIQVDLSLLLPEMPHLQMIELPLLPRPLLRLPYYWEDDVETYRPHSVWTLDKHITVSGLKIFDFHPVFIYLNTADLAPYNDMKQIGHLADLTPEQVAPFIHTGEGAGSMFRQFVEHLKTQESLRVRDVVAAYQGIEA